MPVTRNWIGSMNNAANIAQNWSPDGVPGFGDTLIMRSGIIIVTGNALAGNALTLLAPPTSDAFDDTINLIKGSVEIKTNLTDFTLTTKDSLTTNLVGGFSGSGPRAILNLAPNTSATLTGDVTFSYGLNVVGGGTLINNGTVRLTLAGISSDLDGTGTFDLMRYHDGSGDQEINGSVGANLTFNLQGGGGSDLGEIFYIDQAKAFHGLLHVQAISANGAAGEDLVLLKGLGEPITSYSYGNNVLTLFDGNKPVDQLRLDTELPFGVTAGSDAVALQFDSQASGTLPIHTSKFHVQHMSASHTVLDDWSADGQPYRGPVQGLTDEYILATSENINVTPTIPNVFVHTGSGDDAINVATANGNNVLDGSTGSNFLVGGTGNDTFFLDDRNPTADIWTTIQNLHAGDMATIWGLTPQDFGLMTEANNVLPIAPGLDFALRESGRPDVNLTLTGYSTDDLSNGRLSIGFGHSPDTVSAGPGSDYMQITVNK